MPTYDYQCRSCGAVIEVIHPMSEDGPSVCEVCGGALRRVLFPAGIIFKGPGFYRTDSRASSDGGSSASTAGETGAKPAASSDATKSDASAGAPAASSSKPKGETSG